MNLDAALLRRLSPVLDQMLDLDEHLRQDWIGTLTGDAAQLAPLLYQMLERHASSDSIGLLERGHGLAALGAGEGPRVSHFAAGDSVGPYQLCRELGAGGMGEVWLAQRRDGTLTREVALKLPRHLSLNVGMLERFERERDILARLEYPHIARLYDAGVCRGRGAGQNLPYLALEYVVGTTLTEYCDHNLLDTPARLALLGQVLDAVQFAHNRLVIHRDLKPSNILVTNDGQVRLLDFGVAKLLVDLEAENAQDSQLTQQMGYAFTPDYASPEQVRGDVLDTASDIYSLGVIAYELLCGHRPYSLKGKNRVQMQQLVLDLQPTPPSSRVDTRAAQLRGTTLPKLERELRGDLDTIVQKALRKLPDERYASVADLAADLRRYQTGAPVHARPDSFSYRARKYLLRNKLAVTSTVIVFLALTVGLSIALWQYSVAIEQAQIARDESERATAARDFLFSMFKQVDPENSRGQEITANQLLARGKDDILQSQSMHPLLQGDLLAGIAEAEANLGLYGLANSTLSEIVKRYTRLEYPIKLGAALVQQASVVYLAGDVDGADVLLARAWKVIGDAAHNTRVLVTYYQFKSSVDAAKGRPEQAHQGAMKAFELAQGLYGENDVKTIQALATLARVESSQSQYSAALSHYELAIDRASRAPEMPIRKYLWMQSERARVHYAAGQFRLGAEQIRDIANRCADQLSAQAVTCTALRQFEASMWLTLGFVDRAKNLLPLFVGRIDNRDSAQDQVLALVTACDVLIRTRNEGNHELWWEQLHRFGEQNGEPIVPERYRVNALIVKVKRLLNNASSDQALSVLQGAENRVNLDRNLASRALPQIHLYQGLAQQQLGQIAAALGSIQAASVGYADLLGTDHPRTLLTRVHLARALWATNQREAALPLLDDAIPKLLETMGADAPVVHTIQLLRKELASSVPTPLTIRKTDIDI